MGGSAFDQSRRQTTPPPEPTFDPRHVARVALVIIAEEVQEPMKRQNPHFCR
jgi:hypothetical protein